MNQRYFKKKNPSLRSRTHFFLHIFLQTIKALTVYQSIKNPANLSSSLRDEGTRKPRGTCWRRRESIVLEVQPLQSLRKLCKVDGTRQLIVVEVQPLQSLGKLCKVDGTRQLIVAEVQPLQSLR